MATTIRWAASTFDELTPQELYDVLALRQKVFVVEQNCAYLDSDGKDHDAVHLRGYARSEAGTETLVACARLFDRGAYYDEAAIGRVAVHPSIRREGAGKALMRAALGCVESRFNGGAIRIGAQRYLERFYGEFGFVTVGEPYDEDGIEHVAMVRA